jgi:hypothetical protein
MKNTLYKLLLLSIWQKFNNFDKYINHKAYIKNKIMYKKNLYPKLFNYKISNYK